MSCLTMWTSTSGSRISFLESYKSTITGTHTLRLTHLFSCVNLFRFHANDGYEQMHFWEFLSIYTVILNAITEEHLR